jgi:hypothetical protein
MPTTALSGQIFASWASCSTILRLGEPQAVDDTMLMKVVETDGKLAKPPLLELDAGSRSVLQPLSLNVAICDLGASSLMPMDTVMADAVDAYNCSIWTDPGETTASGAGCWVALGAAATLKAYLRACISSRW